MSSSADKPQRRWLRYSLATFLFVALCTAGLIAGYQSGYRHGYNSGESTRSAETQAVQPYDTTFLIWPDLPDSKRSVAVKELIDLIKSTIATDIWDDGQGNEVREFLPNHSILVTAPGAVHKQVRDLFTQLEHLHNSGMAEAVLPAMQAQAASGKTKESDVGVSPPKNSQMANIWLQRYYEETVQGVTKHWGAPRFRGECRDTGVPDWSLDQRIATWPRGTGLSYIALRYNDEGQLHIVVGWHSDS